MNDLKKELKERKKNLEEKILSDTQIYGKPLGNKVFQDKVDATKRKIARHQESIDKLQKKLDDRNMKKHKLSTWDNRVLDAIRGKSSVHNTQSENTYRYDQRFRGSGNSRRQAKRYFRD
jgi:hypothetical protein